MSSKAEVYVHPANGAKEQSWSGFSWPCLFFGVFWFLFKGLWGWAIAAALLAIPTYGISWLIFPFLANDAHRKSLLKAGWVAEEMAKDLVATPDTHVKCPDCKELVRKDARVCKHCGCKLVPEGSTTSA